MIRTQIEPYLFFNGRCEEAIAFYGKALGAQTVFLARYKDAPQPMPPGSLPKGFENKVMHATLTIGGSSIMVSDGNEEGAKFAGFSLSLVLPEEKAVDEAFKKLSEGGVVKMPLGKTFWSPKFGMLTDKFGVGWMLSLEAGSPA
jgi:PhnB protein